MIKLIAFDLDYTLLRTGGALSPETVKTLKAAEEKGLILVPVTGRDIAEFQSLLPQLGARYAVTVNGVTVVDCQENSILHRETAPQTAMLSMIQTALSMGIYTEVYSDEVCTNSFFYDNMGALGLPSDQVPMFKATRRVVPDLYEFARRKGYVEKLHLVFRDVADKEKRQTMFLGHPDFSYTAAFVNNLELCARGVDKAFGLSVLTKHLGIAPSEVMALGDGANDACMLRWAGLGVAVANAVPSAKQAADRLTLSNDEDGAAYAIRRWALGQD